jgi:hypothetical protein
MFEQKRWAPEAAIPTAGGLLWLWWGAHFGVVGFLFAVIPGCLLLSSGVSTLLYPGDVRISQFTALGALAGVLLALLTALFAAAWVGLLLGGLSAASFIAAGATSVRQEPHADEVPEPRPSLLLAAQVAIDDAILATLSLRAPLPRGSELDRIRAEVHQGREFFRQCGWFDNPAAYHLDPPALQDVTIQSTKVDGVAFEHVSWESGYEPAALEPGTQRWLSYSANRVAHAWVLRHSKGPKPWLLCINGYGTGIPRLDLAAFRARKMHHQQGLNLAIAVLPLHGPRRIGRRSGEGFLAGNFLDTIHAEAQAMWDLRRLLSWIRAQGGSPIGVYGLSLGGYNAALLSCLEDGLSCAIAGIPAVNLSRLTWRHGAPLQIRYAERRGLVHDEVSEILTVVSPLARPSKVAREHRYIFAAICDQLVPPDQPRDLWRHWERPRIEWYQGAHVTFRGHARVGQLLEEALRGAGLLATG